MSPLKPFLRLLKRRQLVAALAANALYKPFYKLSYLAALKSSGWMDRLAAGPVSLESLAGADAPSAKALEALTAWLQMGCRLRLISLKGSGYVLIGLAKRLALPENDPMLALTQEVVTLHHQLITQTPAKLRAGELWGLDNQDAELTARSSRALEAFALEGLNRFIPKEGPCRLLEVGCGSAIYIRHAALRNPELSALGLELQDRVAHVARANIARWRLQDRVSIAVGDIRAMSVEPTYDLVTLYNNIYYFAVDERVALLSRIGKLLKPGGAVLLITCCQGGSLGIEALNLWGASNAHGGRLPSSAEMLEQLKQAGYASVDIMRLIPGDSFYAFRAKR
ncbi:MAG TPA: class I SAM-dependent methyltransferase [Burkholderiaceae bacterium]|nr:class I SAM-dependent methyltransferase [Burkholderiaceae bacterium]